MPQPVGDRRRDLGGRDHADLHRVDADVVEDRVDLRGDEAGSITWTARTPWVFCAVSAVITDMP